MNVIVFASRKGGSGKSTLAAHLAAHVHKPSRACLLVDTDPQGSLTLWHKLRNAQLPTKDPQPDDLPLKVALRGVGDVVRGAKRDGVEWVFIDTAPNMSSSVTEAIRAATLVVVPCRPGVFDLEAVRETSASPGRCASLTRSSSTARRRGGRTPSRRWSRMPAKPYSV